MLWDLLAGTVRRALPPARLPVLLQLVHQAQVASLYLGQVQPHYQYGLVPPAQLYPGQLLLSPGHAPAPPTSYHNPGELPSSGPAGQQTPGLARPVPIPTRQSHPAAAAIPARQSHPAAAPVFTQQSHWSPASISTHQSHPTSISPPPLFASPEAQTGQEPSRLPFTFTPLTPVTVKQEPVLPTMPEPRFPLTPDPRLPTIPEPRLPKMPEQQIPVIKTEPGLYPTQTGLLDLSRPQFDPMKPQFYDVRPPVDSLTGGLYPSPQYPQYCSPYTPGQAGPAEGLTTGQPEPGSGMPSPESVSPTSVPPKKRKINLYSEILQEAMNSTLH